MAAPGPALSRVIRLAYFMAPAYAANMAPPLTRYWTGWNRPISERWLGNHKTVVGLGSGLLAAVLVTLAQSRIAWEGALTSYEHWVDLGLRFGGGAMAGDSVKSFVKRRVGIAPGKPWIPWDQLDFVLGALVLVFWVAPLSAGDLAVILVTSLLGHIAVNHLAYRAGIRDTKW